MLKYKKKVIFLVAASIIFALIFGYKIAYFVLYMVTATIGIVFLWARISIKQLAFTQRSVNDYAYVGDTVEIKTMVHNDSLLPVPCVEIRNEMMGYITGKAPGNNVISLLPFDSRSIFEKFTCKYRGYYLFGPITITVSDLLGLFTWNKEVRCEGTISVFPRVVKLDKFNVKSMQSLGTATTTQKANEDCSSISDIRKYYPGDSLKRIHWKVSAKKGALHVKNFDMSGNSEANIFLNLYRGDYDEIYKADVEERAVECTTAIIHYMLSKNISTSLYANSSKNVYVSGRDLKEFREFMEELITVRSNGSNPMGELLESRSRLLSRGSSIIVVTPGFNEGLGGNIIHLKELGFDVTIIYIMLEDVEKEFLDKINHYGIKLYKVGLSDDVKASLEG